MFSLFSSKNALKSQSGNEYSISSFLPYLGYYSHDTLLLRGEGMMKVIKLAGYAFETADDEDIDGKKEGRNRLFKGYSGGQFALYFHTVRRRTDSAADSLAKPDSGIAFVDSLGQQWIDKQASGKSFVNELYISIVRKPDNRAIPWIDYFLTKIKVKKAIEKNAILKGIKEEIDELCSRFVAAFSDYGAQVLCVKSTKDKNSSESPGGDGSKELGGLCEISQFLSKILNCAMPSSIRADYADFDSRITRSRLYFGSKTIECAHPTKRIFAGIVSLKEYGQNTYAGMLDGFLQIPNEFVITQTFDSVDRRAAIGDMKRQQDRLLQSGDQGLSEIAAITRAIDAAVSGKIAFGQHSLSIMCIDSNPKILEMLVSLVEVELSNSGCTAVRETINMEACFWGQIPGNFDFIVRRATVNTANLAGFVSCHNYPLGKASGNYWGEAVTILSTTSGTPFFFNFHVRDVGHTMIIGPTGSGKTVILNFLCAQAMKFRCNMFFFDKDRGAEIFIRALGGRYRVIEARTSSGFNPLKLKDSPENRSFLSEWLRSLAMAIDPDISVTEILKINEAIEGCYKLDSQDRILRNIVPFLGLDTEGSLASKMSMWYNEGSHAKLFDNEEDLLDLKEKSVFGFEMSFLLQDKLSIGPVLLYLFHRISTSLEGQPTIIVLDEAWALIDNPVFGPKIKDWLKVLRKLNAMVIFATQSIEDISVSPISPTLIQQTATQIFLPNLKATDIYMTKLMLTKREFAIVRNTDPGSRYFLIKQGVKAIVARVDLNGMEDMMNVLSGRASTVRILDEIIAQNGDDPNVWLPIFYERAKKAA